MAYNKFYTQLKKNVYKLVHELAFINFFFLFSVPFDRILDALLLQHPGTATISNHML